MNIIVEIEGIKLANFKEIPAARLERKSLWREITRKKEERQEKERRQAQLWASLHRVEQWCSKWHTYLT